MAGEGYFYCATYGEHGIMPFIVDSLKDYGAIDTTNKNFTLQNGYGRTVGLRRLPCHNYIYSLTTMPDIAKLERGTLKRVLEQKMVNHVLNVPKEYGMFICRK